MVGWMVVYLLSYPVYSFFLPIYSFWCMDDFSWGNTRIVIGDGGNKKVVMNEDERFDESMIPLKKFSDYEAEAWENGSHRSDETGLTKPRSNRFPPSRQGSPHSFHPSITGDYSRDTNMYQDTTSNPNIRGPRLHISHGSRQGSCTTGGSICTLSTVFRRCRLCRSSGGAGSVHGSDYGHMPMIPPLGVQHSGSVYGGMPQDPRGGALMMNMPMMTGGSQTGGFGMLPAIGGDARPLSMFSMATSVNPFAGPSFNPNPTDDDLFNSLRTYLSTQDLMTVTKKTAREAIMAKFPKADLTSRKDFLNEVD
ncbi:chitin synthase-domain-containing protein [Suillus lakei]|nr:chitin synthase-domain-containing protein [Suillus lakei]